MKNILLLIILIPISFNIEILDFDINSKIKSLFDKLNTEIPDFIINIGKKMHDFGEKTYETQQEILINLNNTIKNVIDEIKEKKDNLKDSIKEFIEKSMEMAGLLTHRDCGKSEYIPFYKCRNEKKYIFAQIVGTIKEEFQCSTIIDMITTNLISKDLSYNLKTVLFFIFSMTSNPDSLSKGSTQILFDIENCLREKFDNFWPIVEKFIKIKELYKKVKKDSLYIMMDILSNLVKLIRQDEADGYLSSIHGLIVDEMAQKLQKNIITFSKRFNEFGTNFYNITASLALNVTINPGGLEKSADAELSVMNIEHKGIKVILHSNYLLRLTGAYSLQTIVFESPLVSLRGKREKKEKDLFANIFVGITLYDKNQKEIIDVDMNIKDLRPQIFFKKKLFKAMKTCLFYDENDKELESEGVTTDDNFISKGEKYIRCIPKHLSQFTIGVSEVSFFNIEKYIIIAIICSFVLICLIIGYIYFRKKINNRVSNIDIEKKQNNKKNYINLDEEVKQ